MGGRVPNSPPARRVPEPREPIPAIADESAFPFESTIPCGVAQSGRSRQNRIYESGMSRLSLVSRSQNGGGVGGQEVARGLVEKVRRPRHFVATTLSCL